MPETQKHKLSLFRGKDGWTSACLCGWVGRVSGSRTYAENDGDDHMIAVTRSEPDEVA
jgi:hypothetical protein